MGKLLKVDARGDEALELLQSDSSYDYYTMLKLCSSEEREVMIN